MFSTPLRMAMSLQSLDSTMNHNSNPSSTNLGMFVLMSVAPIAMYVLLWLVLPWIGKV